MPDLVAEFDTALLPVVADPLFREWGGLVLTSAILGRHVWTSISAGRPLYPHIFVALVANSGYGKSTTIGGVREALSDWSKAPQPPAPASARPAVALAAKSITIPRLVRALGSFFPDVGASMGDLRSRCYALLADEISGLLGDRVGISDLQILAMIYDMDNVFDKQTVHHEAKGTESKARDHYMVMAVGAQPAWIAEALPLARFQLGLPARVHFVLGQTHTPLKISQGGGDWGAGLRKALGPTIIQVAATKGERLWDNSSLAELDAFASQADQDRNKFGSLFEGYGVRRAEHVAKMSLLYACARVHSSIQMDDFESALNLLERTEKLLPEVLSLVGANPQRPREDQILGWVRERGVVRESTLRAAMRAFFETRYIGSTLEELVKAGLLVQTNLDQISPHRKFEAR